MSDMRYTKRDARAAFERLAEATGATIADPSWKLDDPRREGAWALDHSAGRDAEICITTELAIAVGQIAAEHPGAITIRYDSERDPENVWRVQVETHDGQEFPFAVDDETGTISAEPEA